MRKRDLAHVYHDLWDHLNDDEADAREAISTCRLLRRVLPHLISLNEVLPQAIVGLLDSCRGMTVLAAVDEIERFVCRDWHVVPPALQRILDDADRVYAID